MLVRLPVLNHCMHCPPSSGRLRMFQGMVPLLELSHCGAEKGREGGREGGRGREREKKRERERERERERDGKCF